MTDKSTRDVHDLAAQILDEYNRAQVEGRDPHVITISHAEAVALEELFALTESLNEGTTRNMIAGVRIQVVD